MRIDNDPKLDFDDVLIRPKRSEAPSRAAIDLHREYRFLNSDASWKGIPVVASNMDTVGTMAMADAIGPELMTCLHKHYPEERLVEFFQKDVHRASNFFTIGIKDEEFDKLKAVKTRAEIRFVCVDAANGYTKYFVERVKRIRETFPRLTIMAGNVATPDMVQELLISGAADIVKIGIGPGSVCTTRLMAGVGYPQLSAIIECADAAHGLRGHVCADGGCRWPGDVVKAFAAGADFVMLGGMLAGHDECEGEWVERDGKRVAMAFYGMSSRKALDQYSGGRRDYRACEGREVMVPYNGPVKETIQEITGGIRSACAYVGATRLKDLSKCTTFVLCSRAQGGRLNSE
jgi:GMP reductase